jgi:hypothetical protein
MLRIAVKFIPMRKFLFISLLSIASVCNAQTVNHFITITNSSDDAEQEGSFIDIDDLELDLGKSNGEQSLIGLYFRSVALESGSNADSAIIILTLQEDLDSAQSFYIFLEDETHPATYNDSLPLKQGRNFYSDPILWVIESASKGEQIVSPDLSTLINQLLSKQNWSTTSGANFIIEPSEPILDSINQEVQIYSYNQSQASRRPQLMLVTDSSNINGIYASSSVSSIAFYPNPVSDVVNFKGLTEPYELSIYDIQGMKVYSTQSSSTSIDIGHLQNGAYFLSIQQAEGLINFKLIKSGN